MFHNPTTPKYHQSHRWQAFIKRLAASRLGSWALSHFLHKIDRLMLHLTRGHTTLTTLLTGVPVVWLTTVGAKSGQPRTVPLLPILDDEKVILIASNWGDSRHPAWYHNLRANPQATISWYSNFKTYHARAASRAERKKYWSQALDLYPGWQAYKQRAQNRQIPIMILSPS